MASTAAITVWPRMKPLSVVHTRSPDPVDELARVAEAGEDPRHISAPSLRKKNATTKLSSTVATMPATVGTS